MLSEESLLELKVLTLKKKLAKQLRHWPWPPPDSPVILGWFYGDTIGSHTIHCALVSADGQYWIVSASIVRGVVYALGVAVERQIFIV